MMICYHDVCDGSNHGMMLIMVMMAIMMMTVSADVGVELVLTPWLIQLLLN